MSRFYLKALPLFVALVALGAPTAHAAAEPELIAVITSADATWESKAEACRELRQKGSGAAAAALGSLLGDAKLSHYARFALENIPGPEAAAALRDALPTAAPELQRGILASIGARRDAESVDALAPYLQSANPQLAEAAAAALGRIGSDKSIQTLASFLMDAPDDRKAWAGEGIIAAAQHLIAESDPEVAYRTLNKIDTNGLPEHVQFGLLEWKARARPRGAHTFLLEELAGTDSKRRDFAAMIIATLPESPVARYIRTLWKLPVEGQIALLRAFGLRGDAAVEETLIAAIGSEDPGVRAAAMQALGALDTPGSIPALADYLTPAEAPEAKAAYESLRLSRVEGVDALLAQGLDSAAPDRCARLLDLLTDRMAREAVDAGLRYLSGTSEPVVRVAAWRALAQLGTAEDFPKAIELLPTEADTEEQAAAIKALGAIAAHNREAVTPLLVNALAGAEPAQYPALLRALERIGSAEALTAVATLLQHEDMGVRDEAAKSLGDWPNAEALPYLLKLAESENAAHHDRGLRGYVRLVRNESDQAKKAAQLSQAMALSRSKEDRWTVLAAYGTAIAPQAVEVLLPLLDDQEVKDEAAAALINVCAELGKDEAHKALSIDALQSVENKSGRPGIVDRAKAARTNLGG
ncbi:MAG: hypothetical protein RLZZ303_3455 [Candidatus Hydrogenedentota bacterium]